MVARRDVLRGEADDRDLLVVVSNLSSIVKRFLAANEEAVRTEQSKGEIIATRTVKETKVSEIVGLITGAIGADPEEETATVNAVG